jgi:hypothetical protein
MKCAVTYDVKAKLSVGLTTLAPRHLDVWGNGGIVPRIFNL